MTLKRFLIFPLLLSFAAFLYYSKAVEISLDALINNLHITAGFIAVICLAVILQIAGHIVRARKAEIIFEPVKENTTRFQFRALSIGYLFNTLLPFRLGELIRARIIAGGLGVSFGYALSLIIIERALDALILGLVGLMIIATTSVVPLVASYVIGLLITATIIFAMVAILYSQNLRLLRFLHGLSNIFRETIKNSVRFKVWSILYGLQKTLHRRLIIKYVILSATSWLLYGCSTLLIAQYLFPQIKVSQKILASVAPYFGVGIPAGPANLGVFSHAVNAVLIPLNLSGDDRLMFDLLSWAMLIVPISVVGLALLFGKTRETLWRSVPRQASTNSLVNKLYRNEDISQEMSRFLENYFSGNTLSRIVHRLELRNDFKLLKYFKGGSDAITILALQNEQEVVKKIIPPEFEDRLKAQYNWLADRRGKNGIVQVLAEQKEADHYAIDLEFRAEDIMYLDFMHQNPYADSTKILDEVWGYLTKYVHIKPGKLMLHQKERGRYIDKHIIGCLEKAASVHEDLLHVAEPKKLIINGQRYDNLYQILEKIKKHPRAWDDIATYRETREVHGDVAVDNILVSTKDGSALLIDPAPDGNIINGPVFDFGKNMQSLYCGYEFLLRDEEPVSLIEDNVINYRDQSSAQYTKLRDYVRNELAPKYLSEAEQRAIIFHAAALHIRRLKHQVYYNPANALKFYAVGVKTLNDFLAQYEEVGRHAG